VRSTTAPSACATSGTKGSGFSDLDLYWFREGTHTRLYEAFGAHPIMPVGRVQFRVWAPNAMSVSVIGDFNDWDPQRSPLRARTDGSGIFEGALEHVPIGTRYKYRIVDARNGQQLDKADPFAFWSEVAPGTASRLVSLDFEWRMRSSPNRLLATRTILDLRMSSCCR
jgi:1,4-alpha-glucan branching enzyme